MRNNHAIAKTLKAVLASAVLFVLIVSPLNAGELRAQSALPFDIVQYHYSQQQAETRKADFSAVAEGLRRVQTANSLPEAAKFIADAEQNLQRVKTDLAGIRKKLQERNVAPKIFERLDDFETTYIAQVQGVIDELKAGKDAAGKISAFLKEPAFERKISNPHPFRALQLDSKTLPVSQIVISRQEISESRAAAVSSSPLPEDLAETEEIQFTQAVRDLAAQLNYDPREILNYVANAIDYIPSYGSKKGADAALIEKAGNDVDQASLLIALLRVSNIPARYQQSWIILDVGSAMDLLGVEDTAVAELVLAKNGIPFSRGVDSQGNLVGYVIDHTYVTAHIDYNYTRGITQTSSSSTKQWIPMDPSISRSYFTQTANVLADMARDIGFNIQTFYDNYLLGLYPGKKPIEALRQEIESYLAAWRPDLTYEDVLMQSYQQDQTFEFIPSALPYQVYQSIAQFNAVPDNLKHKLQFTIESQDGTQTFLNYATAAPNLANKELVATFVAATPEDQAVIDSFPSIYDVIPLSLVRVKPALKANGQIIAGAQPSDPEMQLGTTQNLKLFFSAPRRNEANLLFRKTVETIEKAIIAGNAEGIAINTDRIVLPELRPSQDTQTTEFLSSQKLYRTALNYLYRLQQHHEELAQIIGASFTNLATRAIVFNGIDVSYQNGQPYSFSWKGLRIDSSAYVAYSHRFGSDINYQQPEFLYVFGLESSLDESNIFEEDFAIESMSTVKGLRLINQGTIPGVQVKKIALANIAEVDALAISDALKTKYKDAIHAGNTIYTPTKQFTYLNWTGLVYIDLDPLVGDASYIIGEGLNGGYTVGNWPEPWIKYWLSKGDIQDLTATIVIPSEGQQFQQGQKVTWSINYEGTVYFIFPVFWNEEGLLDTSTPGAKLLFAKYGAGGTNTRTYGVKGGKIPNEIVCYPTLEQRSLPATSGKISEEMHLPLWINKGSGIFKERLLGKVQYNSQDDIYTHQSDDFYEIPNGETNINNPWLDPKTGKYWNMSIEFGAFGKLAQSSDHEKYYINMRWDYDQFPDIDIYKEQAWFFGKKVWIKNPQSKKAVVAGVLDWGPAETTGHVAGTSLEALKSVGAKHGDYVEFCWADQDLIFGGVVSY